MIILLYLNGWIRPKGVGLITSAVIKFTGANDASSTNGDRSATASWASNATDIFWSDEASQKSLE